MPKYKFRNIYKTLLQIWLFYYFVNAIKVHECQELNDVEFINSPKPEEIEVSDRENSDSEFVYEPIVPNKNEFIDTFDDNFDDRTKVDLNVNNNIHENEHQTAPSQFTEISEHSISGEKVLHRSESPFLLRQDLEIEQNAKLTVEPGVTVHFAPMVGITVRGQIHAVVSIRRILNRISHNVCEQFRILSTADKKMFTLRQVLLSLTNPPLRHKYLSLHLAQSNPRWNAFIARCARESRYQLSKDRRTFLLYCCASGILTSNLTEKPFFIAHNAQRAFTKK